MNQPTRIEEVEQELARAPRRWVVTGAAGFIGSNLVERLLSLGQEVVGLDNFSTGYRANLEQAVAGSGADPERFRFVEGDILDPAACREVCLGADFVLHQAALGSVPRSIDDPVATNAANVTGFVNVLVAARDAGVRRVVYAASSSTYGDHPGLPKVEAEIGEPLSPYAVTKYVNELYAKVFARVYGQSLVGLRYFNVFGRRQDPDGAYAAVIPRWAQQLLDGAPCVINGDGETSRDFTYVDNAVQANLLAACAPQEAANDVYNVACGERMTLNRLFEVMRDELLALGYEVPLREPVYADFRQGDVRHSQADVSRAVRRLGYAPTHTAEQGLAEAVRWYARRAGLVLAQGAAG